MNFKIWDKQTRTYLDDKSYFINSDGEVLFVGFLGDIIHESKDNLIIQRSTGLVDLYGNPIFEGDLVQLYYHHANITANEYEIKYSMGRWMLDDERDLTQFWFDNTKFGDVCRVVKTGNVLLSRGEL